MTLSGPLDRDTNRHRGDFLAREIEELTRQLHSSNPDARLGAKEGLEAIIQAAARAADALAQSPT